jgi:hypothetical protein
MNTRLLFAVAGMAFAAGITSCTKQQGGIGAAEQNKIVYVLSNDYHDNANAVLAYKRLASGVLEALPGSPFSTHGAGLANPAEALGFDDTDDPVRMGIICLRSMAGATRLRSFRSTPMGR